MKIKACMVASLVVICFLVSYGCSVHSSNPKTVEVLPSKHFWRADAYDGTVVALGTKVRLNAGSPTYKDAKGATVSYEFLFKPSPSQAVLSGTDSYTPSFVVDAPGEYIVQATISTGNAQEEKVFEVASQKFFPIGKNDKVRIPPYIQPGKPIPGEVIAGQQLSHLELRFILSQEINPGDALELRTGNQPLFQKEKPLAIIASANGKEIPVTGSKRGMVLAVPEGGLSAGTLLSVHVYPADGKSMEIAKLVRTVVYYLYIPQKNQPERPKSLNRLPPFDLLFNGKIVGFCSIDITGGHLDHISVIAPSNVVPRKPFTMLVRPEDRFNYLAKETVKHITIYGDHGAVEENCSPVPKSSACTFTQVIEKPGTYRITVKDMATGLTNTSNPILSGTGQDGMQYYWGVIHGHTVMSYDAIGSLDHYYRQMRDEALLNFGATSDHSMPLTLPKSAWNVTKDVVKQFNEPGKFVTFLGFEWGDWTGDGDGDRCVYYLKDDMPQYYSTTYYNADQLFRALDKTREKALVIPHHTALKKAFNDWSRHDPKYERLVEIYQVRGSFECGGPCAEPYGMPPDKLNPIGYVQHALESGWRVGFTAGGDDHYGTAGINGAEDKDGLMSVLATGLTRTALWDGMWNRRVVATTGARILVNYRVNGQLFGSELSLAAHPGLATDRKIAVEVHGTTPLEKVEIVRNNKVVYTKEMAREDNVLDLNFSWDDKSPLSDIALKPTPFSPQPFVFYYVRVRQYDNEIAWASPLWLNVDSKMY